MAFWNSKWSFVLGIWNIPIGQMGVQLFISARGLRGERASTERVLDGWAWDLHTIWFPGNVFGSIGLDMEWSGVEELASFLS